MYCLTLRNNDLDFIKKLDFIPVGLGKNISSKEFLRDNTQDNISNKNEFYGEYTFHYWLWKNYLPKIKSNWIGFCQYRKFFLRERLSINTKFNDFQNHLLTKIDKNLEKFDCILGNKYSVVNFKFSKIIKNHFFTFVSNPKFLFFKNKRTLKFQFDLFHGKGNLDKAIELLDEENRNDFRHFVNNNTSFNQHNMFICKKNILLKYYNVIFPWLQKCENLFGFENLEGYGKKRIYGFLAERFLSYWFNKNYNVYEVPIIVKDIADYKDL